MLSCDAGKIKLAESMSRFCNEEEGGLVVHGMASKKVPYDEMPSRLDGPERPATGAVLPASMTPPCTGQSTAPKPSRSAPPQRSTSPQTRSPTLWLLLRRDHRRSTQSPHLLLKRRSCLHNRSARKLKWNSRANALTPPIWIPTPPDPGGRLGPHAARSRGRERESGASARAGPAVDWVGMFAGSTPPFDRLRAHLPLLGCRRTSQLPPVGGIGREVNGGRCTTEQMLHRAGDEVRAFLLRKPLEPEAGVDRVRRDRDRTLLVGELAARPVCWGSARNPLEARPPSSRPGRSRTRSQ